MLRLFITLHLICALILSSCGSIRPEAPAIEVTAAPNPEPEVSIIKIPIKINLKPYFKETEAAVPREFSGKENSCEGVSYAYKFYRGPIEFEGKGNKLEFAVDGKYSLKLSYCPKCSDLLTSKPVCISPRIPASCGIDEPLRKIHVGFETKIGVSSNYRLTGDTKLKAVKALSPCEVTVFSYDAAATLEEEISAALKTVEKDIDKEIGSVDLRPDIAATWDLLQEPTDLGGYGFLYLRPSAMAMSSIRYKGDTAYFNALLQAQPTIYLTQQTFTPTKLPKLSEYEDHNGFHISTDIFANYDSLSAVITREVKGLKVDLNGKDVIFGDVKVYGASNRQLHLQVEFSGSKKGTLFLTGTPEFDAEKQFLSFPDLNFDLKTKSALLKSAKWLFNGKITDALRSAAAMDLRPHLQSLKAMITESINADLGDGVRMKGQVYRLQIQLIHPKETELFMRVKAVGKLEIEM
jgi:hypothetical protein